VPTSQGCCAWLYFQSSHPFTPPTHHGSPGYRILHPISSRLTWSIGSRPGRFYRLPWGSFRTMICHLWHLYLTQPSVRCTFLGGIPFGPWSVSRYLGVHCMPFACMVWVVPRASLLGVSSKSLSLITLIGNQPPWHLTLIISKSPAQFWLHSGTGATLTRAIVKRNRDSCVSIGTFLRQIT
jgi:hypothetical protein